eukprot:11599959-Alexandrium_andersonii.AAC.1
MQRTKRARCNSCVRVAPCPLSFPTPAGRFHNPITHRVSVHPSPPKKHDPDCDDDGGSDDGEDGPERCSEARTMTRNVTPALSEPACISRSIDLHTSIEKLAKIGTAHVPHRQPGHLRPKL